MNPSTSWAERIAGPLAAFQHKRSLQIVLLALALSLAAAPFALRLRLDGQVAALLPENARSVLDRATLSTATGIRTSAVLALTAKSKADVLDAADALEKRLRERPGPGVVRLETGRKVLGDFVREHQLLYLDPPTLKKLSEDLRDRVDLEKSKNSPFSLGIDDDSDAPTFDEIEKDLKKKLEASSSGRAMEASGRFLHPKEPIVFFFLRTNIDGHEGARVKELKSWLHSAADRARIGVPKFEVLLGGELFDANYENETLARQMIGALILTSFLIGASIFWLFRSLRIVPLLGLTLLPPVMVTFAMAQLVVGFLNSSTAFLMSIVVGNGVNPSIIWLARYFEERRRGHSIETSIAETHRTTMVPTLAASLAAALAYGSLMIAEFRGFRDFGIIGSTGMVLCWFGCIGLLPALAHLSEKVRPLRGRAVDIENRSLGEAVASLCLGRASWVSAVGIVLTLGSVVAVGSFVSKGAVEYDFRNLISVRDSTNKIQWVNDRQRETVSSAQSGTALALLIPALADVAEVEAKLNALQAKAPNVLGPIRSVHGVLPREQETKLETIGVIRRTLLEARKDASEEDRKRIDDNLPPLYDRPLTPSDLPDSVRGAFAAKNAPGKHLVFSELAPGTNSWDARLWQKWTGLVRTVTLRDQSIPATGTPMIFSDVLSNVARDAPRALLVALIGTMFIVWSSIKRGQLRILTLASLLIGLAWMAGSMALLDIKLHFLNVLAFPIAMGNGVDYAINVSQRIGLELDQGHAPSQVVRTSIRETGGAVVLCSLTTIFGYLSIHLSDNRALNSFGTAMAIAELTCLASAVILLPVVFLLLESRKVTSVAPAEAGEVPPL